MNENEIFKLIRVTDNHVIIKVKDVDNLIIATHPYIESTYDYITVTRGKDHTMTVVKKDGTTFHYNWGIHGYTLVSDSTKELKAEVVNFIQKCCYIPIEIKTSVYTKATIYYNNNYHTWGLTLNDEGRIFFSDCRCLEEMIEIAKNYVEVKEWKHSIAVTGIDVWNAIF